MTKNVKQIISEIKLLKSVQNDWTPQLYIQKSFWDTYKSYIEICVRSNHKIRINETDIDENICKFVIKYCESDGYNIPKKYINLDLIKFAQNTNPYCIINWDLENIYLLNVIPTIIEKNISMLACLKEHQIIYVTLENFISAVDKDFAYLRYVPQHMIISVLNSIDKKYFIGDLLEQLDGRTFSTPIFLKYFSHINFCHLMDKNGTDRIKGIYLRFTVSADGYGIGSGFHVNKYINIPTNSMIWNSEKFMKLYSYTEEVQYMIIETKINKKCKSIKINSKLYSIEEHEHLHL